MIELRVESLNLRHFPAIAITHFADINKSNSLWKMSWIKQKKLYFSINFLEFCV